MSEAFACGMYSREWSDWVKHSPVIAEWICEWTKRAFLPPKKAREWRGKQWTICPWTEKSEWWPLSARMFIWQSGKVSVTHDQGYSYGVRLGVLRRLLESCFLWVLAETGMAIRPPGVDLEGGPKVLQEYYLRSTQSFAYVLRVLSIVVKKVTNRHKRWGITFLKITVSVSGYIFRFPYLKVTVSVSRRDIFPRGGNS